MKVAIFHDYFDKCGGGEKLVLNLARSLNAHVYTGFIDRKKTFDTTGVKIINLHVSKKMTQLHRNKAIEKTFSKLKVDGYDIYIFSGVWCISAAKNHKPNMIYLHTPPRFVYDLKEHFMKNLNFLQRKILRNFIKQWEPVFRENMNYFDIICTNSKNVKNRVLKYMGKDLYKKSRVVYTGFDTSKFYNKSDEGFYLSASRLDPLKRTDLIIAAFKKNGKKLVIVGSGSDENRLRKLAKGYLNISFTGNVSENKLLNLYSRCKATIIAAVDEDLGLVPLESHASGKPCIAVKEGGFIETIKDSKNGIFFKPDVKSLLTAIKKCEKIKWSSKHIQRSAKKYDIDIFSNKMNIIAKNIIKKK
ncbi:glycosyltransferase [Candidatus Aenigmatarchaeota archaeon]